MMIFARKTPIPTFLAVACVFVSTGRAEIFVCLTPDPSQGNREHILENLPEFLVSFAELII